MKTLIINGSPRKNGDTAALLSVLKENLHGEIIEVSAYHDKIKSCNDCRACYKRQGCGLKDDMQVVFDDDYDNVVIASPVYMGNFTPPLLGLISRFQWQYVSKRFLGKKVELKPKKGALILVGGGDGAPDEAKKMAAFAFRCLNAKGFQENTVESLTTDDLLAKDDAAALQRVREVAKWLG